jgi:hypothetical protein
MLEYRAAGAIAILDGGDWKPDLADRQQELSEDADDEIQKTLNIPDAQELDVAVRSAWYGRIGRRIALAHPIGLALVTFRGLLVNLLDSDWDAMAIVSSLDSSLIQFAIVAWTHLEVVVAAIGMAILWRRQRHLALLAGLTTAYFILISAGGEAEYRFRVPVAPLLAMAAAYGAVWIAGHVRHEERPPTKLAG